jgi:hypothetical protein
MLSDEDRSNLVAYIDGELDEKTALRLEATIARDPNARADVEQLKRVWQMLDHLPRPTPSPDFTHQTLEKVTVQSAVPTASWVTGIRARVLAVPFGWAAALLIAAGTGYSATYFLSPGKPAKASPATLHGDAPMTAEDLRVIKNRRLYEHAISMDFLRALADPDDPDLFGDDSTGS